MQIVWSDLEQGCFLCGQWLDNGTLKQGKHCWLVATRQLLGVGGNPIMYSTIDATPVLQGRPPWDYD
ncbi:MAG: hypothetical protein K2X81_21975 [Candidatus Obscuribacterales bacterium]|nr:hypothetical protein [Candidatus Obscuribacterales bacterium]